MSVTDNSAKIVCGYSLDRKDLKKVFGKELWEDVFMEIGTTQVTEIINEEVFEKTTVGLYEVPGCWPDNLNEWMLGICVGDVELMRITDDNFMKSIDLDEIFAAKTRLTKELNKLKIKPDGKVVLQIVPDECLCCL